MITFVFKENWHMKLLVIEGLDGAGKSTQIKLLKDFFLNQGFTCEYLHFPRTDTPYFGELIARFLRGEFGSINDVDPYLVAMLYAGDRKDASEMITSWLKKGNIVILDRYTYSNIAYQCAKIPDASGQTSLMKWILKLEFEHFGIPKPDLNIFLDVPFAFTETKLTSGRSGADRDYLNGRHDIHESSLDFQKRVRDMYLSVAEKDNRLAVVNCIDNRGNILPPEMIFQKIIAIIRSANRF
jgi:dTMP kinase